MKMVIQLRAGIVFACVLAAGCASTEKVPTKSLPSVESGKAKLDILWHYSGRAIDPRLMDLQPACHLNTCVFMDPQGTLVGFDAVSGERLHKVKTKQTVRAGLSQQNGKFWWVDLNAQLMHLSLDDFAPKTLLPIQSAVLAKPVLFEDQVLVQTQSGQIIAIDQDSGRERWRYKSTEPVLTILGTSQPVIAGGGVVLAAFAQGKWVALDIQSGRVVWERVLVTPSGRSEFDQLVDLDAVPVIVGERVYLASFNGEVLALDLYSGQVIWRQQVSAYSSVFFDNDRIYLTNKKGQILALNAQDGYVLWTQSDLENREVSQPVWWNDSLWVYESSGWLYALNRDGSWQERRKVPAKEQVVSLRVQADKLQLVTRSGDWVALDKPTE